MATKFQNLNHWTLRVGRKEQTAAKELLKLGFWKNRSDLVKSALQQYAVLYLTNKEYQQIYKQKPRKIRGTQ